MKTGEYTQYDPVAEARRGLGTSAAVKKGLRSATAGKGDIEKEISSDPVAEMRRSLGVGAAITRGLNAATAGKGDFDKEISLDPVAEMRRKIRTVGYGQSAQLSSPDPVVFPGAERQNERETAGENVAEARTSYTDLRNIRDSVHAQADEMLADYKERIEEGEKEEDLEEYYLKILERLDKAAEYDKQVGEAYGELQSAQREHKDAYADYNAARSELSAAGAAYSQVLNEYGGRDYEERAAAAAARLARAREAFREQGGDPDASIVGAGLSSSAAGVADVFGYLQELGQPENERRWGIFTTGHLGEEQKHRQEVLEAREKAKYEAEHGAGTYKAKPAYQRTQELADRLSGKSVEQIASMKAGRGELGRIAVDMGAQGVQMAADTAAGKLLPGGSLTALALRSFGSGVREARKDGANLYQQGLYGAASAAVEVLTEKMFDGIAGIYGAGLADDLVSQAIGSFTENKLAQTALGLAADALGEGAEEVISDLLNPIIKTIYNDKTVAESFRENWNWSEVLYDFAVGAAMGLVGGSVETVSDMTGLKAPDERAAFFMAAGENGLSFAESLNEWKEHEYRSDDAAQGAITGEKTARSESGNSQSGSENIPGKMPELPSWKRGSSIWDIGTKGERKHSRAEEEYYAVWSKSVNADETIKSLEKFYDVKYNDRPRYELLEKYVEDIDSGWVSPMCGFGNYEGIYNRIQREIIGMHTSNGILVTGQSRHFLQRTIGTMRDPEKFRAEHVIESRSGVEVQDLIDALQNGNVRKIRTNVNGRSQKIYSEKCVLTINPDTGMLIQCNPRNG